jgi:hypothetical protein
LSYVREPDEPQQSKIDSSNRAVRPSAPPWWSKVEQDYFAVHARRDARLAAELANDPDFDPYPETAEDRARRQVVLKKGAELVHQILDLMVAEPVPAARDAATRYLLNREFAWPEQIDARLTEAEILRSVDRERMELRP